MPGKPKIILRGANVLKPPICETTEAHLIEFYDGDGNMNALFCRVLGEGYWGLVTRNDPDWPAILVRYGYLDVKRPIIDVIKHGLG